MQQTIQSIRAFISIIFLCGIASQSSAFIYHWEIDETPEGSESATIIEPVQVTLLDEPIEVASHSASLALMYGSILSHLGPEWESRTCLQTTSELLNLFCYRRTIPRNPYYEERSV